MKFYNINLALVAGDLLDYCLLEFRVWVVEEV